MPVDIDAAVIGNTRLSEDYSVLALAAPEIATAARPGQFVMLKTSRGMDPLLRRLAFTSGTVGERCHQVSAGSASAPAPGRGRAGSRR